MVLILVQEEGEVLLLPRGVVVVVAVAAWTIVVVPVQVPVLVLP